MSPALPLSSNIAGIGQIFSGPSIGLYYNAGDSRAPDILITPNIGVTYSNSKKKLAEHGGFAHDDVNVMMLVSNPSFSAETVTSPVETAQVAPTILEALDSTRSVCRRFRWRIHSRCPGCDLIVSRMLQQASSEPFPRVRSRLKKGGRGQILSAPALFDEARLVNKLLAADQRDHIPAT